jgi:hypothetical protein
MRNPNANHRSTALRKHVTLFVRAFGEQIMALLGTVDFRKSWFGGLSLLVEEEVTRRFSGKVKRRWRRATLMDLAQPELRILIDMRSHPHSALHTMQRAVPPSGSAQVHDAIRRSA